MKVAWIREGIFSKGRLGMCRCPGSHGGVSLRVEVPALAAEGATHVLSLVEDCELESLTGEGLFETIEGCGMTSLRWPFRDGDTPGEDWPERLLALWSALSDGAHLIVHCMAGMNRTGVIVCMLLGMAGMRSDAAVELLRETRHPGCLGVNQEAFLHEIMPRVKRL